jgi:hypothetical protein
MLCSLIEVYKHFRRTHYLHLQDWWISQVSNQQEACRALAYLAYSSTLKMEAGFFWNTSELLLDYKAPHPKLNTVILISTVYSWMGACALSQGKDGRDMTVVTRHNLVSISEMVHHILMITCLLWKWNSIIWPCFSTVHIKVNLNFLNVDSLSQKSQNQ